MASENSKIDTNKCLLHFCTPHNAKYGYGDGSSKKCKQIKQRIKRSYCYNQFIKSEKNPFLHLSFNMALIWKLEENNLSADNVCGN